MSVGLKCQAVLQQALSEHCRYREYPFALVPYDSCRYLLIQLDALMPSFKINTDGSCGFHSS